MIDKKYKALIDKAIVENKKICLVGGGRSFSKMAMQNYIISKYGSGTIAHIGKSGVVISEQAEAEEIV